MFGERRKKSASDKTKSNASPSSKGKSKAKNPKDESEEDDDDEEEENGSEDEHTGDEDEEVGSSSYFEMPQTMRYHDYFYLSWSFASLLKILSQVEEDALEEIDPSVIVGRRTRGVKVDYTSPEALERAGLKGNEKDDESDDDAMKEWNFALSF